MHTLQKPNVLTPCIRLSAVAPQPRAAVRGQPGGKWVGPVGASRGKRGRTGTPGPHWLKAVAALAARWREGERETGADTADSAEQWRGDVEKQSTTGDAASLHPRLGPRAARRRADRLGCESEESEPRRRQSRRQGGVGGRAVTQPEAWQPWLPRDPRPWHSCCESCCS
jgi:hypothetical protein